MVLKREMEIEIGRDGKVRTLAVEKSSGNPLYDQAALREIKGALEFVSGPLVGRTVPLDADVTTIGSVAGNTVLLADTGVSRKHVGIKRLDGGYELADLGSTNGTYVDGKRIEDSTLLPDASILEIGQQVLKHERRSTREVK